MEQPKFLFIFTPPYSGSTMLAKVLNSSPSSMLLTDKGEGQWLVPTLCAKDRWNQDKVIDWEHVRKVWLALYQHVNQLVGSIDVIIEKSPPNILRVDKLQEVFPSSVSLAFNRNPYANCSSILYRECRPDSLESDNRKKIVEAIAVGWLARGSHLKKAIDNMNMLNFSYEDFCENPESCINKVIELCPEIEPVDSSRLVKVKDYPEQGITNQNERQVGMLTQDDIITITKVLAIDSGIVEYFGYELL
jgi:hypothetical protein